MVTDVEASTGRRPPIPIVTASPSTTSAGRRVPGSSTPLSSTASVPNTTGVGACRVRVPPPDTPAARISPSSRSSRPGRSSAPLGMVATRSSLAIRLRSPPRPPLSLPSPCRAAPERRSTRLSCSRRMEPATIRTDSAPPSICASSTAPAPSSRPLCQVPDRSRVAPVPRVKSALPSSRNRKVDAGSATVAISTTLSAFTLPLRAVISALMAISAADRSSTPPSASDRSASMWMASALVRVSPPRPLRFNRSASSSTVPMRSSGNAASGSPVATSSKSPITTRLACGASNPRALTRPMISSPERATALCACR